ncbi:MAG: hypothetical protein QW474_01755 [Candidatus Aenigmatarchaeota archaeon]|nr:hypothetical protein [Candidatus Aenigmarchaeota archaeon]
MVEKHVSRILVLIIGLLIAPAILAAILGGSVSYFIDYLSSVLSVGVLFFTSLLLGIILLLSGIILAPIISSYDPRYARWISYSGAIIIMFSFVYLEVGALSSTIGASIKNRQIIFMPCDDFNNKGIMDIISCIMIGYFPSQNLTAKTLSYFSIILFTLFIPFIIVSYLFMDAIETSGIISNQFYAKMIAIGLSFLAYRGLVVTKLIYILDLGATGISLILINFLFIGIIFSRVKTFFDTWKPLEYVIETTSKIKNYKNEILSILQQSQSLGGISTIANEKSNFASMLNQVVTPETAAYIMSMLVEAKNSGNISKIRSAVRRAMEIISKAA